VAPHGIRGEVRLRLETDFPARFGGLRRAYLVRDGKAEEVILEAARPHRDGLLVSIRGVADRTSAEGWRDAAIAVPRADLVPLSHDSFYVFEIIGMRVRTDDGRDLGTVDEVMRGPANDVYVVRGGKREILVPAVRQVVREVDRRAGVILVTLPAGLEE
jgi:16S rRNA processing protein RimM